MLTRLLAQFIALTLLLSLCSGCAVINLIFPRHSEPPIAPDPIGPPSVLPNSTEPNGNGEGYGVINYYRIKPNYKCTNKDGVVIQSYKDSLQLNEGTGTFKQTGDKCSSEAISSGKSSTLEISNGIISYGNGIYQKEVK